MNLLLDIYNLLDKNGKLYFWLTILFTVLFSLSTTISPLILSIVISKMELGQEFKNYLFLIISYCSVILLTKFCEIILNTAQGFLRVFLLKNIASSYLKTILANPIDELKDKNGGYICQVLTEASNDIYILVRNFSQGIASPLLQLVFVIFICINADFSFVALLFFLYMFLFFTINILLNKNISILRLKMIDSTIDSYMTLSDSVQNIVAIKKNDCLKLINSRYESKLSQEEKAQKSFWNKTFKLFSLNSVQSFIFFIIIFIYGVSGVSGGNLSVASFVLITSYISLFSSPVESMSNVISDVKQSYNNLKRFFKSYKEINIEDDNKGIQFTHAPSILFKDVTFSYDKDDSLVFNKFNAKFQGGEVNILKGSSGSGKSTIAQMITKYISDFSGEIFFSDIPLKEISEKTLNKLVYHVTQDDFIFMDTLRFNLKVANNDATDSEILKALYLAGIDEINGIPVSLDMMMQDSGDNVSGGQKQRISIARLFLRNPKVIILDEVTASLDLSKKQLVLKNIRDSFPKATIIHISHDSEIWESSDIMIDLDEYHS